MVSERYASLAEKYLRDGEHLLAEGDYPQASEKYWGAIATMVKVIASSRKWRHASHRDIGIAVKNLRAETEDDEYIVLFRSAERLHQNFYEDEFEAGVVRQYAESAHRLYEKLNSLAGGNRR